MPDVDVPEEAGCVEEDPSEVKWYDWGNASWGEWTEENVGGKDLQNDLFEKGIASVDDLDKAINDLFKEHTEDYKAKARHKRGMKLAFFAVTLSLLLLLIALPCAAVILAVIYNRKDLIVPVAAAGFAEMLSSLIIIPKIIATYLFDREEDKRHMNLVGSILEHNKARHNDLKN